jgi:AcrR family transcriptional regulator
VAVGVEARAEARLDQLVEAALRVFGRKGFKRAQMSDVAREMGVSQGTLYTYVESKDALFYLLIDAAFREEALADPELPIRTPPKEALLARLGERLSDQAVFPRLGTALNRRSVDDPIAELEEIVRELYGVLAMTWPALAVVEASAVDAPEVAEIYFVHGRRPLVAILTRYLEQRIDAGLLRPVPDPATTARLILESVSWFAWHRHEDPDSGSIDDTTAEETVVDFALHALARVPDGS